MIKIFYTSTIWDMSSYKKSTRYFVIHSVLENINKTTWSKNWNSPRPLVKIKLLYASFCITTHVAQKLKRHKTKNNSPLAVETNICVIKSTFFLTLAGSKLPKGDLVNEREREGANCSGVVHNLGLLVALIAFLWVENKIKPGLVRQWWPQKDF